MFVLREMSWDTMVVGKDGQRLGTTGDVRDPRENERSHTMDGKWKQDKWEKGRSTDTACSMRTKHIHAGSLSSLRLRSAAFNLLDNSTGVISTWTSCVAYIHIWIAGVMDKVEDERKKETNLVRHWNASGMVSTCR